ncbi:MAG: N-acetyltransferase [Alphaproteobacteria bacterium]|nr:N-acetyltransferase [Alphaproteobacteria bacterium]
MSSVSRPVSHLDFVTELHRLCFDKPWDRAAFARLLALPTTRLWADAAGFLMCMEAGDALEILTLCVHPEHRRRGHARALLDEMADYARAHRIPAVFLDVAADNAAAGGLYAAAGFDFQRTRPKYYRTARGATDAVCLVKKITF